MNNSNTQEEGMVPLLQRSGSLVDEVYQRLKDRILYSDLKAGSALQELALAEELGTSRTPVREALRILEKEGLVQILQGRGAYVAEISIRDVVEAYEVRCLLEPFAVRRAVERLTPEQMRRLEEALARQAEAPSRHEQYAQVEEADVDFHDVILEASGHTMIQNMVRQARTRTQRAAYLVAPSRYTKSREEHQTILEALKEADGDRVEELMREHVQSAMERFVKDQIGFWPSPQKRG